MRLTPRGPLLRTYDDQSRTWTTTRRLGFDVLSQIVEIEPGTTISHLFEAVERAPEMKAFLASYCGCDIDALHRRPREGFEPIRVPVLAEGGPEQTAAIDEILVSREVLLHEDAGDRLADEYLMLMGQASAQPDFRITIHPGRDVSFGLVCGLPLRLDPVLYLDGEFLSPQSEEANLGVLHVRFRLLDVLLAVYQFFGVPPDTRTQREVDEEEELLDRLRDRPDAEPPADE